MTALRAVTMVIAGLLALLVLFGAIAYGMGSRLPVEHTASVHGVIAASPEKVFARITDVAAAPRWRPAVKAVTLLPEQDGKDHWVEDLGHGQTMTFLATRTQVPSYREVLLDAPGAAYGGTWTYRLIAGPAANTTSLEITETGYIRPPVYRFVMAYVFGPTRNLDMYMKNLQAAAAGL